MKKKLDNQTDTLTTNESEIYKMQSQKQTDIIKLEKKVGEENVKIIGLYDPEDFELDINMWSNSDGDQLKNIFKKLNKLNFQKMHLK